MPCPVCARCRSCAPVWLLFAALLATLLATVGGCGNAPPAPLVADCKAAFDPSVAVDPKASALRINELVSDNDGVEVDERGETDDYVELYNGGSESIELSTHYLADSKDELHRLPAYKLAPKQTVLLWADNELAQGPLHLPFKLSSKSDKVTLIAPSCVPADRIELPALQLNQTYSRFPDGGKWRLCRYATAGRSNGEQCEPAAPPSRHDNELFKPYTWPEHFGEPAGPLVITELALRPARFIEVQNVSDAPVPLADYALRLSPTEPGAALPLATDGAQLTWPSEQLAPGERAVVTLTADDTSALEATPSFEGVASVFDAAGTAVDRVRLMSLPDDAVLARVPDRAATLQLCSNESPGEANDHCDALPSRTVGDRLYDLQTPGDFAALAAGGPEVGLEGVKFIVDMEAGDTVHLLGSAQWALHYTWIREKIEHNPPLDRCDPAQNQQFNAGWWAFSQKEYFKSDGRRYLLGTLVRHASGMHTVEFTTGDAIVGEQMRRAFFAVVAHTDDPEQWVLRATDAYQLGEARKLEGTLPIVGPDAPFTDLRYQPLTRAVGYGTLRFVPSRELEEADLGQRVILVTDDVPNDIPFVGGLITEAFQTPLAHVNVLSQSRGTPNMALRDALHDPRLAPLFDKLVRLEVGPADLDVREATPEEADAFWQAQRPAGPTTVPPLDSSVRGIQPLKGRGIGDIPAFGAKAAQFAELYNVTELHGNCELGTAPLHVPPDAFAIPVVHYLEHFAASGAKAKLEALLDDPEFRADPVAHEQGLAEVRRLMLEHPVDHELLAQVIGAVRERFGNERVRFRSSSNTEDLPTFNGAGLHTSASVELDDPERAPEDGLRIVWSSLWNTRAFDERDFANVDQRAAAMGVLVHPAQLGEAAQGVAIARDLRDLTRLETYDINAQRGEASVTNPAPGVSTEELLYSFVRAPEVEYLSSSSLAGSGPVLSKDDAHAIACALGSVQLHYAKLLDPMGQNRLFAMQIEWKLAPGTRQVIVKQARPQPFGNAQLPKDCREYE